ncbi:DUF4974 domain-containing protein [Prolixibacteraceae bacterium JC049]|nr:DUF4974 domain-containing protein [Prolixibacteraceae bacterium JC049]
MELNDRNKALNDGVEVQLRKSNKLSAEEKVLVAGDLIQQINEVDTSTALEIVKTRINSKPKISIVDWFMRVAAVLVIPLIIFSVWPFLQESEQKTVQEISCPVGIRTKITLPDGTQVWLNSKSTIKYSLPFVDKKREVELIGEAYLDVMHNTKSPFEISSGDVKVQVLGTQFNFKSYPDEKTVEVALKKGSIRLNLTKGTMKEKELLLKPGEGFTFDKTKRRAIVKPVEMKHVEGWKNNKLVFNETKMTEVARMLSRWYGVDVEIIDDEVADYPITTTFDDQSLSQVIELLELSSPIRIEYLKANTKEETNNRSKIRILKK